MKYMGSKRAMLQNGLGEVLLEEVDGAGRFLDLFTGSAAVSWFVAAKCDVPVLAYDLQQYGAVLANAVIGRDKPFEWQPVWHDWLTRATRMVTRKKPPNNARVSKGSVAEMRMWCARQRRLVITRSYGGHYFSAVQAVWLDALRVSAPSEVGIRDAALAALVQAASECAAAPGHTAQPFQPTRSAKPFLLDAWGRDVVERTRRAFSAIAITHARCVGSAAVLDANVAARRIRQNDLVFIDPPYSGVHYSRFYHVLETVAGGECGTVSGVGRYPARALRPRSSYSVKSESTNAIDALLQAIASRQARAILTFPAHQCSNGLSGALVKNVAERYFTIKEFAVASQFSTLGGGAEVGEQSRGARQCARELILVLQAR